MLQSIGFGAAIARKSDDNDDFVPFFTKNGQKADPWALTEPTGERGLTI